MDEIVLTSQVGSVARRVRYEQVTHGVHAIRGSVAELSARCRAIQRVLPLEALFSHFTGAFLRGWQLPALPEWLPIFASLPRDGTHLKRRGVYIARTDEASVGAELRHGARVAAPWAILAQLAQHLSLLDLIAVVDSALQIGDCSPYDIEESIRPGQWGGTRLRRALEFADGRAESWWETPLRLLHVWSGIDVVPQYEVRDRRGNLIARGDLWIVGTKRLHEYDGGHHDRPETRRVDLSRDKALARIDWERYGYVATDLTRGADRIIRDAESALGLARRPIRMQPGTPKWPGRHSAVVDESPSHAVWPGTTGADAKSRRGTAGLAECWCNLAPTLGMGGNLTPTLGGDVSRPRDRIPDLSGMGSTSVALNKADSVVHTPRRPTLDGPFEPHHAQPGGPVDRRSAGGC